MLKKNRVPLLKDLFLVLFLFIPFPFRYYGSRYRPPSVKIICKFHVQFLAFTLLLLLFTWAIGLCRRNLYYLQLRNEVTEGSLSCSKESAVLLASYAAQGNSSYCDCLLNIVVQECQGLKLKKLGGCTQWQEKRF